MSNKIRNTILVISALFILAGTALYLFRLPFTVYIFATGAVGMTVVRQIIELQIICEID